MSISQIQSLEAALCLFEEFLRSPKEYPELESLRERVGMASLRMEFAGTQLLEACDRGWSILSEEHDYDNPFDWEYCPAFLQSCTHVVGDSLCVKENWQDLVLSIPQQRYAR